MAGLKFKKQALNRYRKRDLDREEKLFRQALSSHTNNEHSN